MPTNRPTMEELTIAVREFLEEKVQPEISDSQRFHMRVAINVLKIIERELASGDALNSAERKRLMSLLGEQGDLTELDKKLAEKISDGSIDIENDELFTHLWETTVAKLAIDNPNYSTYKKIIKE